MFCLRKSPGRKKKLTEQKKNWQQKKPWPQNVLFEKKPWPATKKKLAAYGEVIFGIQTRGGYFLELKLIVFGKGEVSFWNKNKRRLISFLN